MPGNELEDGRLHPVFSADDTINWYEDFLTARAGDRPDFVGLFLASGMNHCSGGGACDPFAALNAIVNWVENGVARDQITATAGTSNTGAPWLGPTRPLCAWPEQAHYTGAGDIEDAANFVCQ